MTITQILTLTIGCLALLLSSELIRSTLKQRRSATVDTTPAFRQVGTFGGFVGRVLEVHGLATAPAPVLARAPRDAAFWRSLSCSRSPEWAAR